MYFYIVKDNLLLLLIICRLSVVYEILVIDVPCI